MAMSVLAVLFHLLAFGVVVWGLPIHDVSAQLSAAEGNRTTLRTQTAPGLVSSAIYRGTFDILWSCLLTLTACIYSALHLNIPLPHTPQWSLLWRKVRWAALALIAPEVLVLLAADQYLGARHCQKKLRESTVSRKLITADKEGKSTPPKFDLRYGFYVVMGGLTLDVQKLHDQESHLTLTPEGVITLAKHGHFINISLETVSDRSKANFIAKALVCAQVLWMIIQCIARKINGYPLTLLEIHTMVHVVCALIIYSLWWKKPLDIGEPTILGPSDYADYEEIIALMLMNNFDELAEVNRTDSTHASNVRGESSERSWHEGDGEEHNVKVFGEPIENDGNPQEVQGTRPPEARFILRHGEYLQSRFGPNSQKGFIYMSTKDVRRWKLADQAMRNDEEIDKDQEPGRALATDQSPPSKHNISSLGIYSSEKMSKIQKRYIGTLAKHSANFTVRNILILICSLIILSLAYGGIHLAAWDFDFPSRVESLLWKIAGFIIMLGPVTEFLFVFLPRPIEDFLPPRLYKPGYFWS